MAIDWFPMLSFVFVASITPGPNNLTVASMGMRSGFKRTLPFVFGVYFGVALILVIVGFLKIVISDFFFQYVIIFKIAGSAYLLYLAFNLVRKQDGLDDDREDVNFFKGVILQLVNPKGLFFAMTMYALFLTGDYGVGGTLALSFLLPLITILCVGTWSYAGSFISGYLGNPQHRKIFYWTMALLLVYTVITILTKQFTAH